MPGLLIGRRGLRALILVVAMAGCRSQDIPPPDLARIDLAARDLGASDLSGHDQSSSDMTLVCDPDLGCPPGLICCGPCWGNGPPACVMLPGCPLC
jgi:hypothetical protein